MSKENHTYCTCLYYSVNALSRVMTKMADEAFSVTGLTSSYAFLLMIVNAKPGVQPSEISAQMQLTPSTVTRLIEKMEYRGFLRREPVGRTTEVYPTKASLDLDVQIREAWDGLFKQYANILGADDAKKLTMLIRNATVKLE